MGWEEIRKDNNQDDSLLVHSSSIALLQERFRQLQKVKEMREEREVVKLLSLSQYSKTAHNCCSFFFNNNTNSCVLFEPSISHPRDHHHHHHHHHQLMMMKKKKKKVPPTTMLTLLPQTSLSLSLTSSNDIHQPNNIPTLMDLWPVPPHTTTTTTTSSCDTAISFITKLNDHHHHCSDSNVNIDVDTSLHL